MSNEVTIGFDCSQSRDWLQHLFPSCLCLQRSASILKGSNISGRGGIGAGREIEL